MRKTDADAPPKPQYRRDGFTLLEVLVALIIAGLAITALLRATGIGLAASRAAAGYQEAITRARSHLAALTHNTALVAADNQGQDGGGFHWRTRVAPEASVVVPLPGPPGKPGLPVILYAVTVWISWNDGGTERVVRLDSAQLASSAR